MTVRACCILLAAMAAPNVHAQAPPGNYPNKQIRVIVPFPAGGPTDAIARAIGQNLNETWRQPVPPDLRRGVVPDG